MNYQKLLLPIALVALSQACTSLPKTSDAAPAPKTNVSAIAPANNRTEATPPVISSEPLPIADARVQSDRAASPRRPQSCAPDQYGQFFWQFVKDNDMSNNPMRMPYSAASITVRNYENPNQVLEVVKKQNYQGFKIDSVDYTLVYDDPTITDPKAKARLKREVKRLDDKTFRVDYVRAEFEVDPEAEDNNGKLIRTYGAPGAYIFEHQNGCWTLTQEYRSQVTGTDRTAQSPTNRASDNNAPKSARTIAVEQFTDLFFYQANPALNKRAIRSDESAYRQERQAIYQLVDREIKFNESARQGRSCLPEWYITNDLKDRLYDDLTDVLFGQRYPAIQGGRPQGGEEFRLWDKLRQSLFVGAYC
jgi:hypothetical protein